MNQPALIKPTVGRKVWYRPSAWDKTGPNAMQAAGDQPLDATVIAVWSDACVNLFVVDAHGKTFTRTSTRLVQDGETPPIDASGQPIGGYAEWMPYQTGQAKKAAA